MALNGTGAPRLIDHPVGGRITRFQSAWTSASRWTQNVIRDGYRWQFKGGPQKEEGPGERILCLWRWTLDGLLKDVFGRHRAFLQHQGVVKRSCDPKEFRGSSSHHESTRIEPEYQNDLLQVVLNKRFKNSPDGEDSYRKRTFPHVHTHKPALLFGVLLENGIMEVPRPAFRDNCVAGSVHSLV